MGLAPNGCGCKYRKSKIKLGLTNFSYKILQLTNSKKYDIIYIEIRKGEKKNDRNDAKTRINQKSEGLWVR